MKKKLVASLAAAMVLGVAGTSFAAANPFADVPAKNWAYDSVMKLTQAGIVDGYGDGTFKGDKLITRYEMAQIVAKAMARSDKADAAQKAEINKLAAEFADELNVLGVRVSSLENKVGSVKVTGDARIRFNRNDTSYGGGFLDRLRLNLNANVNDNTSIYARIMDQQTAQGGQETLRISDLALTSKNLFNSSATGTVGRFSQQIDTVGYFLGTTGMVDGAKITAGNDLKVTVGMADFSQVTNGSAPLALTATQGPAIETAVFATADYKTSKVTTVSAAYLKETSAPLADKAGVVAGLNGDDGNRGINFTVPTIGFKTTIAPNVGLIGEYMKNTAVKNSANEDPMGYVARLTYKGVNPNVQGSWGTFVEYYKFTDGMLPSGGNGSVSDFATTNIVNLQNNQKAVDWVVNYAVAKNIVVDAIQTFGTKNALTGTELTAADAKLHNYTRLNINYLF